MEVASRENEISRSEQSHDGNANFGFQQVPLTEKQGMVNDVFNSVAQKYDIMNDLMSGGMHRLWKDALVSWLSPPAKSKPDWKLLDVAGGTGDISFRALNRSNSSISATVCDINESMLAVGRQRAVKLGYSDIVRFMRGNAEDLPFPDRHFDAYTIAFGIRNVPRMDKALSEAFRVLKHGGRFLCLEFSEVDLPILDRIYDLYSFNVIPQLGRMVMGDQDSYRYLVESIRKFPNQEKFGEKIRQSGFSRVSYRNLSGGIAAIHSGWRI